ncbi:MAG: hypothetical protein LH477_05830 [Nocardioides sp.]|nr:hypothetical protein [Nocardioides sp.]
MSRSVVVTDRVMAVVLGLVLVLAGLALGGWYLVAQGWVTVPVTAADELSTAPVQSAATAAWWPWALGVAGLVLTLLGLRWLTAHLPDRGVGRLRLSGTGAEGRLEVDAGAVASAAAASLEQVPGARSARGRVLRDRGSSSPPSAPRSSAAPTSSSSPRTATAPAPTWRQRSAGTTCAAACRSRSPTGIVRCPEFAEQIGFAPARLRK